LTSRRLRLNIRAREQRLCAIVLGVVGCGAKSLKKLPKDWLSTTFGTFEGGSGRWAVTCIWWGAAGSLCI